MKSLLERFAGYVAVDTTSAEDAGRIPSSDGQKTLATILEHELVELGLTEVDVDEHGFVFATIPPTKGCEDVPVIGFLAHLDTAPDCVGCGVTLRVHNRYDGGSIIINEDKNIILDPATDHDLIRYIGDDIVTSDGTTLLGADDKSGIAIIMDAAATLIGNPTIRHGKIRIGFTPDEEISTGGAAIFDVEKFGADMGFTVDGDGIGELNIENFNAAKAKVTIRGTNIHTAEAKGKMVNAAMIAMAFDTQIPRNQRPEYTEGYEGFYHLSHLVCGVGEGNMEYVIRDFEKDSFENRITTLKRVAEDLNKTYGQDRVMVELTDEYANMKQAVLGKPDMLNVCKQAYREAGLEPALIPIRGGTDGATLAELGLACPNIFLGGHNYHSVKEYVSVQAMEKARDILVHIARLTAKM